MWPFCLANNPLWLLLPFLIGLATGWWAWGHRPAVASQADDWEEQPLAAELEAEPVSAPAVAALAGIGIPAAIGDPDDLLQVKGIGPSLNKLLNSLGVTRFDQIAAWTSDQVATVDGHLGAFKGRIVRDSWVEQASLLARGAIAEFESRFGTLDSENRK